MSINVTQYGLRVCGLPFSLRAFRVQTQKSVEDETKTSKKVILMSHNVKEESNNIDLFLPKGEHVSCDEWSKDDNDCSDSSVIYNIRLLHRIYYIPGIMTCTYPEILGIGISAYMDHVESISSM